MRRKIILPDLSPEQALALYEEHKTLRGVATALDCSHEMARRFLKARGVQIARRGGWTEKHAMHLERRRGTS